MEFNKNKFALAAATTIAIWYAICAFIVALIPGLALTIFGWMIHLMNLESAVSAGLSFPGVVYGFVAAVLLAYLTGYVFAWFYNRFNRGGA